MTVTFFTNFINHHQVYLADELYNALGDGYTFVETQVMPESFARTGYVDYSDRPYLLKAYAGADQMELARRLALESDVVIFGSAPEELFRERLKRNKLTLRYSERWFKKGDWQIFSPRVLRNLYKTCTRYRRREFYLLCAGAFVANDAARILAYPGKCFKWGYFTRVDELDMEPLLAARRSEPVRILWCGRFIAWKHPELAVRLAEQLSRKGYDFRLDMIGSGEEEQSVRQLAVASGLEERIAFLGNMPNARILEYMRGSPIFIFTSDRGEGWGAVLNEAMSNGCAVVASDSAGSPPFLIEDGVNGYLFRSGDLCSLTDKVERLIRDQALRESFARRACDTMKNVWSPAVAARNLLELSSALLEGRRIRIAEGPCSEAKPMKR